MYLVVKQDRFVAVQPPISCSFIRLLFFNFITLGFNEYLPVLVTKYKILCKYEYVGEYCELIFINLLHKSFTDSTYN